MTLRSSLIDMVDHECMMECLKQRVVDPSLLRITFEAEDESNEFVAKGRLKSHEIRVNSDEGKLQVLFCEGAHSNLGANTPIEGGL